MIQPEGIPIAELNKVVSALDRNVSGWGTSGRASPMWATAYTTRSSG